jgi:hypothetical protein
VALLRTDVSEERIASVVISFLIISILMTEAIYSSETSVLTRGTRRHIPEDGILHSGMHDTKLSHKAWHSSMVESVN